MIVVTKDDTVVSIYKMELEDISNTGGDVLGHKDQARGVDNDGRICCNCMVACCQDHDEFGDLVIMHLERLFG